MRRLSAWPNAAAEMQLAMCTDKEMVNLKKSFIRRRIRGGCKGTYAEIKMATSGMLLGCINADAIKWQPKQRYEQRARKLASHFENIYEAAQ